MAKLLIVEDDEHQQLLLAEEFRLEGHEVLLASSGAEALEAIGKVTPDLVVLDVAMPKMDGIEALGRILAKDNRIPIVIHTAYTNYKDNFMAWSADAYVVKSSDPSELKAEVKRVLARRALQRHP